MRNLLLAVGLILCSLAGWSQFNVTFRVDMNNVTESFTTPEVNGTFNSWCGGCAPMSDADLDGIWELVIPLNAGTYEYKFAADTWTIQETLSQGAPCTVNAAPFVNRSLVVSTDVVLDLVCWGSCAACSTPGADLVNLTFDDVASVSPWQAVADATLPEAVLGWNATGVTTGALDMSGTNTSAGIGRAYIFQYLDNAVDYMSSTAVELSFDVKLTAPLNGAALHLQTEFPGVGTTNTFDIQNSGVNDASWTHLTYPISGIGTGNIFRIQFNIAAGAFVGAGGQVLVDNIKVTSTATGVLGCTDNTAANYNSGATDDDGSCLYNVLFKVNMNEVATAFTTPEVNGTFNSWCGGCAPMSDPDLDGIWELTIPLAPGNYEYKFAADSWATQETLTQGAPCTVGGAPFVNRSLAVSGATTLDAVCWGSCNVCGYVPPLYNVTFQVDMNNVTDPFTAPEVNGTFNSWCGNCASMSDVNADGIWEVVVALEAGSYEYKFSADAWNIQEALTPGAPCTVTIGGNTNRTLVVSADMVLSPVCWNSCNACLSGNELVNLTFDDAASISVWQEIADATLPEANMVWNPTGVTTGALDISGTNSSSGIGRAFIYQYLDNTVDYASSTSVELSFDIKLSAPLSGAAIHLQTEFPGIGTTNTFDIQNSGVNETTWTHLTYPFTGVGSGSLFRIQYNISAGAFVGAGGAVLIDNIQVVSTGTGVLGCTDASAANYNSAATVDDGSCTYNVLFRVNMNEVAAAFTTPEVNGNFNGWCGGCAPMSDADLDGIWELTIALAPGTYEYKFAADGWNIQETLAEGASCTVNGAPFVNRSLVVAGAATLDAVCWGSCNACGVVTPVHNVTFRVDMNNVTDAFTTPEVNGQFNGWCGGCAPMSDADLDGIWEITIPLEEGAYEYKFAADGWNIQETLTEGSSCTVTNSGFTNRFIDVTSDITLDAVCWASCNVCAPPTFDVTFRVDMNNVTDGFTTPEVNGIFNGWCGGCAPMSDADLDGVWELVIALPAGSYEYKFAADGWNIQESLTPGSACTVTNFGFTNRIINVTENVVLDAVCWNSCVACAAVTPEYDVTFRVNMNGVTDPFTTPEVNGIFNGWCGGCAPMSDANGDGIWELVITLEEGTYEYKFAADSWTIQESLTEGAPCTINGAPFVNRLINVNSDIVLDAVCWGSCDAASLMMYADNDGDGFGAGTGSLFCVAPASGYSANNTDCNDNNANIYPGATEVCGNATDEDCDGFVNEGCSLIVNDNFANSTSVNASTYPFCSNKTVNLTGATASPEATTTAPVGAGQDVWYAFVASSQGARITSTSVLCDVVIELQDAAHNAMFVENETTVGAEVLVASNLTAGNTYYVLVRNFNPSSVGTVATCIQNLATSAPDNGTTFNNLCSFIKCDWNGAQLYSVTFDDGVNQYTASSTSTQIPFSLLPGIQYGMTYDVTFTSTFIQNDAGGNPITSVVVSPTYAITIEDHLPVALRSTDRCPTTRSRGSFIGADRVICGVVGYQWEFTLADDLGNPISIEPVVVNTTGTSRYVRVSSIAGVQGGDYYNVRVRPVFSYGAGTFGDTYMLCVAGSAGMVENNPVMDMSTPNTGDALEVAIYPNPTAGEFVNVRISNITSETIQVKVLDAVGRVIMNNQYSVSGSLNSSIVFDRTLASGLYTLEVIDGNAVVTEKMIVE